MDEKLYFFISFLFKCNFPSYDLSKGKVEIHFDVMYAKLVVTVEVEEGFFKCILVLVRNSRKILHYCGTVFMQSCPLIC